MVQIKTWAINISAALILMLVISTTLLSNTGGLKLDTTKTPNSFVKKITATKLNNLKVSGYYRFYGHYRNLDTMYQDFLQFVPKKKIDVGDGYREPMMLLNFVGNPTSKTSISTDLYVFNPYNGTGQSAPLTNNIALNLYGSIQTDVGTFNIKTGGIHWFTLSPFTIGNVDINKYSIFDRTPWERAGESYKKYDAYYEQGNVSIDERFSDRAFKGIIVEGVEMPNEFAVTGFYGKFANNLNDGVTLNPGNPNFSFGGKIEKRFKTKTVVSFNNLNNLVLDNNVNGEARGFNIATLFGRTEIKDIAIETELGLGNYFSQTYDEKWGQAFNIKATSTKKSTKLPISLQAFYISPEIVNLNGSFANTSNLEAQTLGSLNQGQSTELQPFASPLTNVGIMTNNRWGVNLSTEIELKNFKLGIGNSVNSEIERLGNQLSYNHRINGLSMSRLYFFTPNVGPYERLGTYFRGAYEVVNLTDTATTPNKSFNTLEIQGKYRAKLSGKSLILLYYGSFGSSQNKLSAIPVFNDNAWLRAHYHEFECQYQLFNDFMLLGYYGFETVKGNLETDLDAVSGLPRDQEGWAGGLGIDFDFTKNTSLHLRHRIFSHKDKNFQLDQIRGTEGTVELKVSF